MQYLLGATREEISSSARKHPALTEVPCSLCQRSLLISGRFRDHCASGEVRPVCGPCLLARAEAHPQETYIPALLQK